MNSLVTWLSCPGLEVSGHIIHTFLTFLTRHRYVPTRNYKHSLKVNYYAAYACSCVSLQRIIVFFNCDLQTGNDAEKSEGVLNFSMIVLKQKSLKFWRLPNVNSVNWISSFKLSRFKVVQRYNVAFRFLYLYTAHVYYAHIFIRKICCCYACRPAGDFYKLLGRAGFLMDMRFLCVFLKRRHCFERGRSQFLRNPSDMELFRFKRSKNIFHFWR